MPSIKKTADNFSRTQVQVVERKDKTTLVQYVDDGLTVRKYIPSVEVGTGQVLDKVLERGIPYGYPWGEIDLKFDSQKFANEMHAVNIWTVDDALKFPQKLWSALNATLADEISKILSTSLKEKRSTK